MFDSKEREEYMLVNSKLQIINNTVRIKDKPRYSSYNSGSGD